MAARLYHLLIAILLAFVAIDTAFTAIRDKSELYFYVPCAVASFVGATLVLYFVITRWRTLTLPKGYGFTAVFMPVSLGFLV